jgi:hypothetical protein
MKNNLIASFLIVMAFTLSGCEAIASIFKAGVWSGVIIVVLIIALVIFIIAKLGGRK